MKNIMKLSAFAVMAGLLASYPASAQTHGTNAAGGAGADMNGGSGSTGSNEGYSTSETPANSGSRAINSSPSTTNGSNSNRMGTATDSQ